MKQVLYTQAANPSAASATINGFHNYVLATWSASTNRETLQPTDGTYRNLRVTVATAPGAGKSWVFALRVDGTDTALTLTISDTNVTNEDAVHEVTVTAGQRISISATPSGTPDSPVYTFYDVEFESDTAGESIICGTMAVNLSTGSTEYLSLEGRQDASDATETNRNQIIPTPGTLGKLFVLLSAAPGAAASGKTRTFTVMKNGSPTAITLTVTETATSNNDSAHTVAVVAGDTISLKCENANTPAASLVKYGIVFTPDSSNHQVLIGQKVAALANTAVRYFRNKYTGGATYSTAVTGTHFKARKGFFKNLYMKVLVAPGNGQFVFTQLINGLPSALKATLVNANTTCNDLIHEAFPANTDLILFSSTPTGTPTAPTWLAWGMVWISGSAMKNVGGITYANLAKINGVAIANVKRFNTIQ